MRSRCDLSRFRRWSACGVWESVATALAEMMVRNEADYKGCERRLRHQQSAARVIIPVGQRPALPPLLPGNAHVQFRKRSRGNSPRQLSLAS